MEHGLSMWDEEKDNPVQRWTEHLYFIIIHSPQIINPTDFGNTQSLPLKPQSQKPRDWSLTPWQPPVTRGKMCFPLLVGEYLLEVAKLVHQKPLVIALVVNGLPWSPLDIGLSANIH